MKKWVVLLTVLFCSIGCSLDDDVSSTFMSELVPIEAVTLPDTLVFNSHYMFKITYERPTSCHFFEGLSHEINGNERLIGVVNGIFDNPDCEPANDLNGVTNLNFLVERNDFYIFKFWQGNDEDGEPIFLTKEVPVKIE